MSQITKNIVCIFLLVLFLLFQGQIIDWYDSIFVNKLFCSIKDDAWTYFSMCALVGATVFAVIFMIQNDVKIRDEIALIAALFLSTYIYYRFTTNRYHLVHFSKDSLFKYSDYTLIFCGGIIVLRLRNYLCSFQNPQYGNEPFITDAPILSGDDDMYGRVKFAALLAQKIQSKITSRNSGSLAIGINGAWGAGKTSFINLIERHFKKDNRIVIHFNPWRSTTPAKIVEDFFNLVIDELKVYDPKLSNSLSDYAKTLTEVEENTITKSIATLSDFFFGNKNKNETYHSINESIKKINKHVIIFIDDLDRLDKKETVEILRIIRNTANFNNVVYLVAYDKSYVLEAIKDFNPHNYSVFLEKIFQFEFLLPTPESSILRRQIKTILIKNLDAQDDSLIPPAIEYLENGRNLTSQIITTPRDVVRLCNSILFEIKDVIDSVNFIDFYLIQLLKIKFESIYKFLSDYRELVFVDVNNRLRLRKISERNTDSDLLIMNELLKDRDENAQDDPAFFTDYITRMNPVLLNEIQKQFINDLISALLTEKPAFNGSENNDMKAFMNYNNFEYYFSIRLLESNLPLNELQRAKQSSYEDYEKLLLELINKGKALQVIDLVEGTKHFSTIEEWDTQIKSLLAINKYQFEQSNGLRSNTKYILEVINYPGKRGDLSPLHSKQDYMSYIKNYFRIAQDPYIFEAHILVDSLKAYDGILAMTQNDVIDQLFDYFKKYCDTHTEITPTFYQLYACIVKKGGFSNSDIVPQDRAVELFVKHFRSNLQARQLGKYIRQSSLDVELFWIPPEDRARIFTTWSDFEEYLNTAANLKAEPEHLNEMIDFYQKLKANEFKSIEYSFKYLQPNRYMSSF